MSELIGQPGTNFYGSAVATERVTSEIALSLTVAVVAILYVVGAILFVSFWIFVIYLLYQIIVVNLIPAIYEITSTKGSARFYHSSPSIKINKGASGLAGMNENAATLLTANVTEALLAVPEVKNLQ